MAAEDTVWTTDDSMLNGRRNNLLIGFSLDTIFAGLEKRTGKWYPRSSGGSINARTSPLAITKSMRIDAKPSGLFYDDRKPGKEMVRTESLYMYRKRTY
eukprot:SAG25_NODE_4140_length_881_cov_1.493606_2_plen_99_part_00